MARAAKVNPRFAVAAFGSIVGIALILFSVPQLVPILREVPQEFLAGGAAISPGEPDPPLESSVSPVRGDVSGINPTASPDPSDASDDTRVPSDEPGSTVPPSSASGAGHRRVIGTAGPGGVAGATQPTPIDEESPTFPSTPPRPPQCSDGFDNDADGYLDRNDPSCSSPFDDSEGPFSAPPPSTAVQCADGFDNDADRYVDVDDPACTSSSDNTESPFNQPPSTGIECADGFDNDSDGYIDEFDPSCLDSFDDTEAPFDGPPIPPPTPAPTPTSTPPLTPSPSPTPAPTPQPTPEPTRPPTPQPTPDPTPQPTPDPTPEPTQPPTPEPTQPPTQPPTPEPTQPPTPEPTQPPTPEPTPTPQCADGVDNDGDLFIDWPLDLGCSSPSDDDESGPIL